MRHTDGWRSGQPVIRATTLPYDRTSGAGNPCSINPAGPFVTRHAAAIGGRSVCDVSDHLWISMAALRAE
jgi:hypothetical protein